MVIVGAGFGGLEAAKAMRDLPVRVTVVDRHNYHLFQPLLYQVATGLLDPSEIAHPVRSILRRVRNARVLMAEVESVDLAARTVRTSEETLSYHTLVLATGSATDFFGDAALRAHSSALKHLDEALDLRAALLRAVEEAASCQDVALRRRLLSVVVVGAGPTGVEYSGAAAELLFHVLPRDFPELDFSEVSVVLIEGGRLPLGSFAPRLGNAAARSLQRKRVQLRLGRTVRAVEDGAVVLDDGSRVAAATVVWTAGVRASLPQLDGAQAERDGRLAVSSSLHLPGHPEVFVVGDAALLHQSGAPLPMLAPFAIQGGHHVAAVLRARFAGRPDPAFHYRDKGTMATVGRGSAVAQLGPLRLSGFPAWCMWLFVHLIYLVGFRSRAIALVTWGWDFFFYDRPIRLIVDRSASTHSEVTR